MTKRKVRYNAITDTVEISFKGDFGDKAQPTKPAESLEDRAAISRRLINWYLDKSSNELIIPSQTPNL